MNRKRVHVPARLRQAISGWAADADLSCLAPLPAIR